MKIILTLLGAPQLPEPERAALLAKLEAEVLRVYGGADGAVCALHAHLDGEDAGGIPWLTGWTQAQAAALQGTVLPSGARLVAELEYPFDPDYDDEPAARRHPAVDARQAAFDWPASAAPF